MYECNPTVNFDDQNLPDGLCDEMINQIYPCAANIASGWAVGGNEVSTVAGIWICRMYAELTRRLSNSLKWLAIQLEVISKSNITWFKCTMTIRIGCQVKCLGRTTDRRSHNSLDRTDSSGIRFYLGKQRREHELGYLSLGAEASHFGIAIPPLMDRFVIDSYCPASGTQVIIRFRNHSHSTHRTL